ncbi:hypothetical protein LWI29_016908 [Acer saccharum]|uniref:KIB1-4 beta-propeller domain-containing protein n=1 Tax=Acer saccharum TaxID=4024 RepID=A0AA39TQ33_ACESA|nr:hypothetical protein LWI29_016908 [Acer saccharum]
MKEVLAFCRPDDKCWKYSRYFDGGRLEDAVFYKCEFYAVNYLGHIFHLDCNIGAARKLSCLLPIEILERVHHNYLVELDGNLLVVLRYTRGEFTSGFQVYELNWVEKVWINVKNIGNNAILLGKSSSISLPINHLRNFKANCIYFLWDNLTGSYRATDVANY